MPRGYLAAIACSVLFTASDAEAQPTGAPPAAGVDGPRPVLLPYWRHTAIGLPAGDDLNADSHRVTSQWIAHLYRATELEARGRGRPVIPPAVPVVDGNRALYANTNGVVARAIAAGTFQGERYQAGELLWDGWGDHSLFQMARDIAGRVTLDDWMKPGAGPSSLGDTVLHRTLCHQVAVHKGSVLFVDDAGLLPPPRKPDAVAGYGPHTSVVRRTVVRDFDLASGVLLRYFGNKSFSGRKGTDFFTLGMPLTDGDLRTCVREVGGSVRLLKVDFPKYWGAHVADSVDRGVEAGRKWEVELAKAPVELGNDPHRRAHAIHLTEAGGLIIAPTNLGRVIAVDALTGVRRWAHEYARLDAKRFPAFAPEWVVVPPVVVRDRYLYAPADFAELLCLNVHTGKKVWGARKGDGVYPAVVGEQVLVIGEKAVRSLKLHDGSEQWKADLPGLPCGRGAVLGETYLVPVSEPKSWKGMIAVVDLKAGKVIEVLKPDADQPIGNLVVHPDFLISQTLTEIAAFPIRK